MRSPRVNYVAVGAFVAAMIVVFVGVLAILTGRTGATDPYYTHYDNVMGVVPGTQLLFEGYRVGQVVEVAPSEDPEKGRYRVTFAVDRGTRIPEDSVAWITEPSLLASITVDIRAGRSETFLEPGSEFAGRDLQSLFGFVATLTGEVEGLLENEIRPLLSAVATATPEILANLEVVTEDLARVTAQVTAVFSTENTGEIDTMIGNLSAASANLGELTTHLESSLSQVDGMVGSVNGLVTENTDGVERMIKDLEHTLEAIASRIDEITASLESASHNMDEFSGQLRRNPAVLIRGNGASADEEGSP